ELIQRLPGHVRYVGVGVGKRWNRSFMKLAAERTGGYFTQINPDEPIGWRAFDLAATLNTPRLLDITVADDAGKASFLTYVNSIAQGEDICAIARIPWRAGGVSPLMPQSLTLTATLDGQPYRRTIPVHDIAPSAGYLPRTWAKLEIDRLLSTFSGSPRGSAQTRDEIIALSKSMYVMTPFTSLLVLENEQMYEQFKVDRGRKDHWAMYPCPDKIPIVYEPDPDQPADPRAPQLAGQKPHRNQVMQTVMVRKPVGWLRWPGENAVFEAGANGQPRDFLAAHELTDSFKPQGFINDFSVD